VLRLEISAAGDESDWTEVRRCEADVLGHWYGDTPEQLDEVYGPYEDHTVFVALRRPDERVVGFCRLILPGPLGLKTISDVGKPPWSVDGLRAAAAAGVDVNRTWDIATLGVDRKLAGAGQVAAAALYYAVINAARSNGYLWIAAIIDSRARSLLAAHGLILHALPGTAPGLYMGSPACAPVYAHLPDLLDYQRRVAPDAHRLIALGVGLDGIATPPPDAFQLPPGWAIRKGGTKQARSA
jgi:hypothetical protein